MPVPRQRLDHSIRQHILRGTINEINFPILNTFSNEMILNVNLFRPRVIFGIVGQSFKR